MLYVKVSRCLLGDPSSRDKRGIGRPGIVTEKHPMAFLCSWSFQLFDLIYREETLFNVIKSVTRNGRSILLTALLALILVYLFSIVGFLFLKDDFILEVDRLPDSKAKGASGRALAGCRAWAGRSVGPFCSWIIAGDPGSTGPSSWEHWFGAGGEGGCLH